jgi:hypothetical protein
VRQTVRKLSEATRPRPDHDRRDPPIRRAALAAQGKKARVALVCRDNETISDLLRRLDASLGKAMAENTAVDEVIPEIKRRRSR